MPLGERLTREQAFAMAPHELGREILDDLPRTTPEQRSRSSHVFATLREWRPRPRTGVTTVIREDDLRREDPEAVEALEDAWDWIEAERLVRADRGSGPLRVTKKGQGVLQQPTSGAPMPPPGGDALVQLLHPRLAGARERFRRGEYAGAVQAAGVALEEAVRKLTGLTHSGDALFMQAFRQGGPLADPGQLASEAEGERALFTGFVKAVRNPAAHRAVDYSDPMQGVEDVLMADKLMRLVERSARRLGKRI